MARKKKKRRWRVTVKRKSTDAVIAVYAVMAYQKRWATRIAVLFHADRNDIKTSELDGEIEHWDIEKYGDLMFEDAEWLAAIPNS